MEDNLDKELIKWYQSRYLNPNCYHLKDDPKIMRMSGIEFILERPRNCPPMEPKRVMNKVRIWDGTPTQKFFGKKKGESYKIFGQ
jgi:hypothetical protein